MAEWKSWCRLCASYEETLESEEELGSIFEQVFEIAAGSMVCHCCNDYMRAFQNFYTRSREVKQFFDELEQNDGKPGIEQLALNLRLAYSFPLPDNVEVIESLDPEVNEILEEAEVYHIGIETSEVEYAGNENDQEQSEQAIYADTVTTEDGDNAVYAYEECAMESNVSQDHKAEDQEPDEISQHFSFKCHLCSREFPKMYYLTSHSREEHNCLPRVECSCGRFIGSTKVLEFHYNNHIRKDAAFRCHECNKVFKTESNYNAHMKSMHSNGEECHKFQCTCGKTFKEARHLEIHKNTHLPDNLKFIHPCNQCNKSYSSIFSLRHHVKHVHVKEPTFICPHCKKMFSRKANLDSHVSHVHTLERKFECDICGQKVKTSGILRVHKKIHSVNPEDFHSCDVCQRQFKTRNQLTNHKVCHATDKLFKCTSCPAEYKRSKELVVHVRAVHVDEPKFLCAWCPKTFFNNTNFRKHKLKCHPDMLKDERS